MTPTSQVNGTAALGTASAFAQPTARQAWPKTRAAFWLAKITGNKARDQPSPGFGTTSRLVNRLLRHAGWHVLRIWEHELRRKAEARLLRRLPACVGRSA